MTAADRVRARRMLRKAERLYDAARDHQEAADEFRAEASGLVDAINALVEGRPTLRAPWLALPDLRH